MNPTAKWPVVRLFVPTLAGAALALLLGIFAPKLADVLRSTEPQGPSVKALCVAHEPGKSPYVRAVFSAHPDDANQHHCQLNDTLQFTYSNAALFSYVWLMGIDAANTQHPYVPSNTDALSIALDANALDAERPLLRDVSLADHKPGELRVVAWFSRRPLSWREMQADLESLGPYVQQSTFAIELRR